MDFTFSFTCPILATRVKVVGVRARIRVINTCGRQTVPPGDNTFFTPPIFSVFLLFLPIVNDLYKQP